MFEYIIRNQQDHDEFYSTEEGWVDWSSCTRFSRIEQEEFYLPRNGEWCSDVTKILAMENTNA